MTQASVCSGIGAAELAAEWAGWENIFHCEKNDFSRKVLDYYWPKSISYEDLTTTDFRLWRGKVDVFTAGFPCQPFSTAGKRKGTEDDRHLWPHVIRAIREIQPRYVVGENVRGFTNWNGGMVFDQVLSDLENEGYEVAPFLLPACGVNAPHRRDRIWIVAQNTYKNGWGGHIGKEESSIRQFGDASSGNNERLPSNNGETGTITHPSSDRREREWQGIEIENREQRPEQSGFVEGRLEGLRSDGITPDPDQFDGNLPGLRTGEISQQQAPGILENYIADAKCPGLEGGIGSQRTVRSEQGGEEIFPNSVSSYPDGQQRCEGRVYPERPEEAKRHTGTCDSWYPGDYWQNFPTESGICQGNDGFSSAMDLDSIFKQLGIDHPRQPAIGFAKWRNESIKAYGNAMVPQVMYEIFKVINQIESQINVS